MFYDSFQFKFNEVKEYFIDLTGINIDDDTNIIFFSFNTKISLPSLSN